MAQQEEWEGQVVPELQGIMMEAQAGPLIPLLIAAEVAAEQEAPVGLVGLVG